VVAYVKAQLIPDIALKTRSSYYQLIPYIRQEWKTIAQALTCTLGFTVFWPIQAALAGRIAEFIGQGNIIALARLSGILAVVFLLQKIMQYGQDSIMAKAALAVALDLRKKIYSHLLRLNLSYFETAQTGDLTYRLTEDIDRIGEVVNKIFHDFTPCVLQLIVVLGYMIYLNWQLTLATFIVAPLMGILIGWFGEQMLKFSRRSQNQISNLSSLLTEVFSGIRLVQGFAAEEYQIQRFATEAEYNRQAKYATEKLKAIQNPVVGFLYAISVMLLFFLGGWQISIGNLTSAEFVSYIAGVGLLIDPIAHITSNYNDFKQGEASVDRIFELMAIQPKVLEKPDAEELPQVTGKVEYRNVTFAYPGNPPQPPPSTGGAKKSESSLLTGGAKKSEPSLLTGAKGAEPSLLTGAKGAEPSLLTGAKGAESSLLTGAKGAESSLLTGAKGAESSLLTGAKGAEPPLSTRTKESEPPLLTGAKESESPLLTEAKESESPLLTGAKGAESSLLTGAKESEPPLLEGAKESKPPLLGGAKESEPPLWTGGAKGGGPVLQNMNLLVSPGEMIALVGPSGAGKTTLANLLPRFYDPQTGQIFIDGVDIKNVTLRSLRRQIGIVPQETILFSGTIAQNIAFGQADFDREAVEAAAKIANAHQFITQFSQGYQTWVGERGVNLSGGQRQRIAIARAVLLNPRILILDEATSALDSESEALVQEALERIMKDRTVFIIAHRLATVRRADRILVLERGQILESGTHEELLQLGDRYARFYAKQFQT